MVGLTVTLAYLFSAILVHIIGTPQKFRIRCNARLGWNLWGQVFTGQMTFLPFNQQRQGTNRMLKVTNSNDEKTFHLFRQWYSLSTAQTAVLPPCSCSSTVARSHRARRRGQRRRRWLVPSHPCHRSQLAPCTASLQPHQTITLSTPSNEQTTVGIQRTAFTIGKTFPQTYSDLGHIVASRKIFLKLFFFLEIYPSLWQSASSSILS